MKQPPISNTLRVVFVSGFLFFALFGTTLAVQWWPLVPCGLNKPPQGAPMLDPSYYEPCNQCDLIRLGKNLIDFIMFAVTPIVAVLWFVWAGFLILTYGANPGAVQQGTNIFWNTVKAVALIMIAWLLVNTALKSFVKDKDIADHWWELQCSVAPTPSPTPVPTTTTTECSDLQALAKKNNVPYPQNSSPELNALISCVLADSSVSNLIDRLQMYTYDRDHNTCNYTRGDAMCDAQGKCSHSRNSCHYGGASGTDGAEAVDFNAINISREGELLLYARLKNIENKCNFGFILFEESGTSYHTHGSTKR